MKIMHVIDGLARGGAETLLINTIQMLPHDEHIVICLSKDYEFSTELKKLFQYYTFPIKNKLHIPLIIYFIRRLIRKHNPDVIHANLLFPGIISKIACPRRIPFFYTIHSEYSKAYFTNKPFIKWIERFTARSRHHLIGVSKLVIDDYTSYIPNSGTRDVLYNFVGEEFFKINRQLTYTAGSSLRCIAVGNLKRAKNYGYILSQFALLIQYPITLDIYGTGSEEINLKKYKEAQSLVNVTFKGRADNVEKLMLGYDVFIACSITEGFGIAPLEAMAARLPVIVSSIPVFKEIIGNAGFFIETSAGKSGESLSSVLKKIYTGQLALYQHVQAAYERVLEIASQKNYIVQLKQVYQKYNPKL
ncbi:MAG: glycosyltransferase [Ferruginibacter sp.]|nr:glycosyltransferase [Ferruginibacter sp.]